MKTGIDITKRMQLLKGTIVLCKKSVFDYKGKDLAFIKGSRYEVKYANTITDQFGHGHTCSIEMFMLHFKELTSLNK